MPVLSTRWIPKPAPPEPAATFPVGLLAGFSLTMLLLATVAGILGWELSPLTWYLARASGISLYLVLWASTVLGLGLTTHLFDRLIPRSTVFSLHAYLTTLSFAFLGMHMLALGADKFMSLTLADLLIPFHSGIREPWTGLGIIAAWLLLLMAVSFPLRRLTGYRFWRKAHWLTLPLMAIGLTHGLGAGTDTSSAPMRLTYLATGSLVLFLVLYRAMRGRREPAPLITARPMPFDRMTARSPRAVSNHRPA